MPAIYPGTQAGFVESMADMDALLINEHQAIIRLAVAAFLGACIGLERERRNQPAGLRTHMILTIGAALAMIISINLATQHRSSVPNGDPSRLAAQVISGIGFLGAGAILRFGASIKGLTTATSLWTAAIIGLATGAGHFLVAAACTALILITLTVISQFEKKWLVEILTREIHIRARDREHLMDDIQKLFNAHSIELKSVCISKNVESNEIEIVAVVNISDKTDLAQLMEIFSQFKEIKTYEIH